MNTKVRVGIVGLGDHCTQSHINHLLTMKKICEIVALCDLDHDKAKDICNDMDTATANGVHYYSRYKDMLKNKKVEAVFIMTPDKFHTEQLVAAVEAGKHVFCEKPLASTQTEYEQLVKAFAVAEKKGLIVTTCHPRRFDPPFNELNSILTREYYKTKPNFKLGRVLHFDFNFLYHEPSKEGLHTSLMFDHLNHEVDAMNYLFGTSGIKHATKNIDAEDQFHVSGVRKDGITFSFFGQRKLDRKIYPEYMRVQCEYGYIDMNLHYGKMKVYCGDGSEIEFHDPYKYKTDYELRFSKMNEQFIYAVMGRMQNYLTPDKMLMNTKLAIDLHEKTFVEY